MQPSSVSTLLTGGVSVGIIAGVVSGLFYLVVAGFRWAGEARLHSGEWFQKQIQRRFAPPSIEDVERRNGSIMQSESSQVREFIEHLVEALVSGGIDHVNVNRLYSHPDYARMFETYHSILCDVLARLSFALQMAIANKPLEDSDSPSSAHTELKQLVQCVVREAMTLPALHQNSVNGPDLPAGKDDINSKTYEDILATAILNKVIERFQLARLDSPRVETDGNSNLLYKNRSMEHAPKYISSLEIGMTSGTSGSVDGMGPSSLEDASWSESSAPTEPTSLTIEECIEEEEEVTLYSSEEEEQDVTGAELDFYLSGLNFIKRHRVPFPELGMDIVDGTEDPEDEENGSPQPTDLVSPVDSWEENWLFQRRRLKVGGVNQPLPVPMLVPNPSEDYRALIGDRDAEETSDLSDCCEGVFEGLLDDRPEDSETRFSRLSQELSDDDSIGDFVLLPQSEFELAEARNAEISNSVDSSSELGQQDSEYTEDYASVTQRQMHSLKRQHNLPDEAPKPIPKPRTSVQSNASESATIISNCDTPPNVNLSAILPLGDEDPVSDLATPPRPGTDLSQGDSCMNKAWTGTIAEREHKKWESAAPLPNNPYSSENILKRLSKSSLLDIRPTCSEKVELTEKNQLPKAEKILVQQLAAVNISRYGRDYYVNSSRPLSSGLEQPRPVEIVMSSDVDHPVKSSAKKELLSSTEVAEVAQLVENEVSRLQKEINEQEEIWRKNIKSPKSQTDLKIQKRVKTTVVCTTADTNGKTNNIESDDRPKTPQEIIGEKILEHMMPKNIVIIERNNKTPSSNQNERDEIKNQLTKSESKPMQNSKTNSIITNPTKLTNGDSKCAINGKKPKKEKVLVSGSESSRLSSDSEGNIPMPSVKNLAKQFSECNALIVPKVTSSVNKLHDRTQLSKAAGQKTVLPMREVHSLTARSISREFREELKRNLPTQQDRNMHASDSCPSQQSSSDLDTSTTAGYTSDESNSISPIPGLLRNNIAFWEEIQRNNK